VSILVVGSVALDSVQTPFGEVEDAVGGAAVYFSAAASLYERVNLVGVVGEDFRVQNLDFLRDRNVDLSGLQVLPGKTFRWKGRYDYNLNTRDTLDTQLNVFADFHPRIPPDFQDSDYVFLANIHPQLQLEVLHQMRAPRLTAMDTMNYWIESEREDLTRVISEVDIIIINEEEARQLANTYNLVRAAGAILDLGPRATVVKRGEYGATLFYRGDQPVDFFFAPAYPLEELKDPTGAGDTFAGGFMGYLAKEDDTGDAAIRRAMVHGSVIASYAVEDFSLGRLRDLTLEDIEARYQTFRRCTLF
jgi:sugar/nucleoside kinase (ribokinase family)